MSTESYCYFNLYPQIINKIKILYAVIGYYIVSFVQFLLSKISSSHYFFIHSEHILWNVHTVIFTSTLICLYLLFTFYRIFYFNIPYLEIVASFTFSFGFWRGIQFNEVFPFLKLRRHTLPFLKEDLPISSSTYLLIYVSMFWFIFSKTVSHWK